MRAETGKPRGLLNRGMGERKFQLSLHQPSPALAPFVEHHWIVVWDLRGQEPYLAETLPHPAVHLVFERDKTRIVGVMRGKFAILLRDRGRVLGVKFRPGAFYPFLGAPVSRLTDRAIGFQEVFGTDGADLERAILARDDEGGMVALAEAFLHRRLPARDETVAMLGRVVEQIIADRGIITVDDVARLLGRSTRTTQRLFGRYVGVSPKWVIKRYRLHEAAERLAAGDVADWPALALELGYCDQAHFIRDFRSVVGRSPAEYAKRLAAGS